MSCQLHIGVHVSFLNLSFKLQLSDLDLLCREIRNLYNVHAVPKLVIAKPNGDVITMRGRKEVTDRGVIAFRSWFEAAELKLTSRANLRILDETNCSKEKSEQ